MTYGDLERTRLLAGDITLTLMTDGDMNQAIAYGDSMVNTFTGKSDWTTSDDEYEAIQSASEYYAPSYIRDRFNDDGQKAKAHYERAMETCRMIRMGAGVTVVTQSHRTYPLNPDATPYRSISGGNNTIDDSDLS